VVPNINRHIHWVIAVVVFLSLLPGIIGARRAKNQKSRKPVSSLPHAQPGQD
jgi:hypothetical protein